MLTLVFLNLNSVIVAYLLVKCFLYYEKPVDYLLSFFIFFLFQIILKLELLGILNILELQNIMIVAFIFLLLVMGLAWLKKRRFSEDFRQRFAEIFRSLNWGRPEFFALAVILGFGLVKFVVNLANPPFGWDDLNYHFTFPVEWLKNHSLNNPIVAFCDPSPTYYPINGSLFYFWFILPLRNVFIADLGQVPFFVVAFFAVYSLARKLDLSKRQAFFCSCLFTLVPNYFKQVEIAYVDIMVACLFLIALNYLFLLEKNFSFAHSSLYAISLGLLIGTKTTALPLAVLIFIPFVYLCLFKAGIRKGTIAFLSGFFFIILMGGFCYIRNFIQTGNPVYPLHFKLFGKVIFEGVIDSLVYRAHVRPQDWSLAKLLFSEGLGAQTVILVLPALILGLPIAAFRKKRELSFMTAYFLFLPFLIFLAFRFFIPLPNVRYIYALLAIGIVNAFYILKQLRVPQPIAKILFIVCAVASMAELAKGAALVIGLLLSCGLFFILPPLINSMKKRRIIGWKGAAVCIVFLSVVLYFAQKDYVDNEYRRYVKMADYSGFWPQAAEAWAWLDGHTQQSNIAYVGRPVPFPLYGEHFKNNVYYVSVNRTEPAMLHRFPGSNYAWGYDGESVHRSFQQENNYRSRSDYSVWLGNLLKRNTDYLFIYSLHQTRNIEFPFEDEWAESHPETFSLVFKNDIVHIYKIIKGHS